MDHFQTELMDILIPQLKPNSATVVLGDFNLWLGDPTDKKAVEVETAMADLNFIQLTSTPTHTKGHTLDWLAVNNLNCKILESEPCIWSDHFIIPFQILLPTKPKLVHAPTIKTISRNYKNITDKRVSDCMNELMKNTSDEDTPEALVDAYIVALSNLLNRHAPLKEKTVRFKDRIHKWWTNDLETLKKLKRSKERSWIKSKNDVDKADWKKCANEYKKAIEQAKKEYYNIRIQQTNNSTKELFAIFEELKHPIDRDPVFSPEVTDCVRAQNHFKTKITKAREKIRLENLSKTREKDQGTRGDVPLHSVENTSCFSFQPISIPEMILCLQKLRPTSVTNDACPSKVVYLYPERFAPFLTRFVNSSFNYHSVPEAIKHVQVTPLLKKPGQDPKDLNNLRPITNVMTLLKIVDKIATGQFQCYLETQKILHFRQSGFRQGHSTESALLDLQSCMFEIIDTGDAGMLILLDLSAAFDLLDHHILLSRLEGYNTFSPGALGWIRSFLSDRIATVNWGGKESEAEKLAYGVPQGACLSPALFNLYMRPLFESLEEHGIMFTNFADDTQLLIKLTGKLEADQSKINSIYGLIKEWMSSNWMCLNNNKTELMLVTSTRRLKKLQAEYKTIFIDRCPINTLCKVKTLGVTLDSSLTMDYHTNALVSSTSYYLKLLRQIRPYLTTSNCASIARAVIATRLDYCNSLLVGTSTKNLNKLQVIQNQAVRTVMEVNHREHISKHRRELHWLPVRARTEFKTLAMMHKCLHGNAPEYLGAKINFYKPARTLRSDNQCLAVQVRASRAGGLGKAFQRLGPSLWNNLPLDLRMNINFENFKKRLKSNLFEKY